MRNFWSWGDTGGAPQPITGVTLGGALEPLGESSSALLPCNVDTQDVRTRFWDGKDNFFRDDITMLKGNHLFTFGGAYQPYAGGSANSPNLFANPAANYANFRAPILGIDGNDAGLGPTRGLPYWNLDLSVRKNIRISERFSTEFQFLCLNTLNHMVFANPSQSLGNLSSWGALTTQGNTPRQMEFGIRFKF